jgi:succinoglycan biosynthesis transport protein ExoP
MLHGTADAPTEPTRPAAAEAARHSARRRAAATLPAQAGLTLAAALAILRRRRLTLALFLVLVPLLAWIALQRVPPRYTATGAVFYDPAGYAVQELQSILRVDPTTDAVLNSQAEILRSLRIAERVADRLDLAADPAFNPALRPPGLLRRALATLSPALAARLAPPAPAMPAREAVLRAVEAATQVVPVHASRVLAVSFTASDPALAARAANLIMQDYIDDQVSTKVEAVRRASDWLKHRAAELRTQVREQEDRIAAYRSRSGLVQGVQADLDTERVSRLDAALVQARGELAQAQARLHAARGGDAASAAAAIAPSVAALRARHDDLEARLQALLARLGPSHPDVLALRSEVAAAGRAVAAETARVANAAAAEADAARARVATLEADLAAARTAVEHGGETQIPLHAMQREAEASRTQLQSVLDRIQQTAQQAAIETPDARIISEALPPAAPSFPRTAPMMAAAFAAALFLGLIAVWLSEVADSSFRSGDDIREQLGLPCFALVPRVPNSVLGRLRVTEYGVQKPLSPFAEQLRALRAGLWIGRKRPRVIAVTAARPGEGKTTVTLALARAAASAGERVIAIDCDIRQPAFGRLLQADGQRGVGEFVTAGAALEEVIHRDPLTPLDFIPAGTAGADALALFTSDAMTDLLDRLRAEYDLILLDAPPALAIADARVIAHLADATLFCIRWADTARSVVLSALGRLEDAEATVAGVALTRVDARAHRRAGYSDSEIYHPRYGGYFRG